VLVAQASAQPSESPAYRIESLTGGERELRERFDERQIGILEQLNRRDRRHLARLKEIVVPAAWHEDEREYSPLPRQYAWAATHPKAIVVHQPWQVFGAYEHGELVRWGAVSSGRRSAPTPAGLFHLNWRSRGRCSTVCAEWYMPWYWNFDNRRGLGLHEFALPGHPASHSCIRLLERDARWFYDWGEGWQLDADGRTILRPGTPLFIVGAYDFDAPPPWHSSGQLAAGLTLPAGPEG
jgi:hypothetical protein